MIRWRKSTTVLKQMPTRITAPWNPFQETDFCEGEGFNINMKLLVKINKICYLIRDAVTTPDSTVWSK